MKKLEKYKIAPQTKFVKFKMKHFVDNKIRHDKAVSLPWLLKFSSCPPCLADGTKIIPPDPRGGGHYDLVLIFWTLGKDRTRDCLVSNI